MDALTSEKSLAAAIIGQAVSDLEARIPKEASDKTREKIEDIAVDAARFLLRDLWHDDCLWGALICDALSPVVLRNHVFQTLPRHLHERVRRYARQTTTTGRD